MNKSNFYVISPESKEKLIQAGFTVVNELQDVNGKAVWVMHADSLNFDIDTMELPGVVRTEHFHLTF